MHVFKKLVIMKYKLFLIPLFVLAIAAFSGCNKDDDDIDDGPCSVAWTIAVQDEVSAMSAAAQTYAQNQTVENCNNYKTAAQAYINALEPYNNCAALSGTNKQEWQAAIESARQSINEMDCQ